jgi:adenylate kinase
MKNQNLFNIVLLGAPGSGKGTQADLLKQKYNLQHASTGDLYRKEMAEQSPLGIKAKNIIERGDLCPDELTLDMLYKFYSSREDANGFLLDGVPRTLQQAKMMEGKGYPHQIPVTVAVYIDADDKEVTERLIKRAVILKRADDTPEVIKQRIDNYHIQTKPLIDYYLSQNKLVKVNGMQKVEKVFEDINSLIDQFTCP